MYNRYQISIQSNILSRHWYIVEVLDFFIHMAAAADHVCLKLLEQLSVATVLV